MVIWPFVGIPWCVPAGLGLVAVLQRHGIEEIGKDCFRYVTNQPDHCDGDYPRFSDRVTSQFRDSFHQEDLYQAGREIHLRTYAKVNNPEVRELLSIGFPEFRKFQLKRKAVYGLIETW
jgi:hypothetical protein